MNGISIYQDGDLAALTALMFRNAFSGKPPDDNLTDQLQPYKDLAATVPSSPFHKTMNAITDFYSLQGTLVDDAQKAVNAMLDAYNKLFKPPLIGWSAGGFTILDQVTYMARLSTARPASEQVSKQLAALLLVVFRNSADGTSVFDSFKSQLSYYLSLTSTLPAADDFNVTVGNIQKLNTSNPSVIGDAQTAISIMFTAMTQASQLGAIDWGNCAYTEFGQIAYLGGVTLGFSPTLEPLRMFRMRI